MNFRYMITSMVILLVPCQMQGVPTKDFFSSCGVSVRKTLPYATVVGIGIGGLIAAKSIIRFKSDRIARTVPLDQQDIVGIDDIESTVYLHGNGNNKSHGRLYHCRKKEEADAKNGYIRGPLRVFNFQDHCSERLGCIGQDGDMDRIHQATQDLNIFNLDACSRGATAGFNYLCSKKYQKDVAKKNIVAIFESPFSHLKSVLYNIKTKDRDYKWAQWIPTCLINFGLPFLYNSYKSNGIQPIKVARNFPKHVPVLLVCSEGENSARTGSLDYYPSTGAPLLYKQLLKSGHKNAHLVVFKKGTHGNIINHPKSGKAYRNLVHAFKRKHDRPYHRPWADAGEKLLRGSQPSIQQVDSVIQRLRNS